MPFIDKIKAKLTAKKESRLRKSSTPHHPSAEYQATTNQSSISNLIPLEEG